MKYRSIVISGPVAAGSSTAAKALAEKLNLKYYSAGDFFRQYSIENKIPLPDKEKVPDNVEIKIDQEVIDLAKSPQKVVIDALYAGYFTRNMKHVLKILLAADEKVRVQRAIDRVHTHRETEGDVKKRDKAHDLKFRKLYANENFLDPKFFDLKIDTTKTKPEEVIDKITKKFLIPN